MTVWSEEIDAILSVGRSLKPLGSVNWALNRLQALKALDELWKIKVPVLGGDAYRVENGQLLFDYAGWYCDQDPSESLGAFTNRSYREAREYIADYPTPDRLFVIVPSTGHQNLTRH